MNIYDPSEYHIQYQYLICILYIILLIVHLSTICHRDFYRGLISIFTFALFTVTTSTILEALNESILTSSTSVHYVAQLIYVTSINFFILFLLIIAKGWPITRRDMPFKYAFAAFWLACLAADLTTFNWTTITPIARNYTYHNISKSDITNSTVDNTAMSPSTTTTALATSSSEGPISAHSNKTINEYLTKEQEEYSSTKKRLSLLLRIVIMLFFLLELRTTMILEQEKKKLQFYLHFGALAMVWFVHTLIVYIISGKQAGLVTDFSSAANWLAFAVTTRLLWPTNSRSDLFRKRKRPSPLGGSTEEGCELDNFSTLDRDEDNRIDEYDGLQMRDLNK